MPAGPSPVGPARAGQPYAGRPAPAGPAPAGAPVTPSRGGSGPVLYWSRTTAGPIRAAHGRQDRMQLLLIRHATNDWVGDRLAGWTPGVQLNDAGRAEAAALAARLAGHPIDAVYSSPLERALETARFVAAPHGLAVQPVDGLGEVHYGTWTGLTLEDLREDPLWRRVQSHPSGARFPDGETMAEVQARAVAATDAIVTSHPDGVVAAVTHGDVIKALVAHYAGLHLDMFQRLVVATASVSVLAFSPHGPRLFTFNDTGRMPPPPRPPTEAAGQAGESHGRVAARV
jgi:probable phosphomutase (TIGR03848 family)